MKDSDIQRIEHIRDYCLDVQDTIRRFGADYEKFLSDKDYYKSISMSIMQIGEISAGLSDGFKENSKPKFSGDQLSQCVICLPTPMFQWVKMSFGKRQYAISLFF